MAIMDPLKTVGATVRKNPIGAVVGGVAGFYLAKKFTPVTKTWMLVGIGVVGALAGAYAQSKISAKAGSIKSGRAAKK
jgi:hypothetical protein